MKDETPTAVLPWSGPRNTACKRIENGRYVFCVRFDPPLPGGVPEYSGTLEAASA